MKDWLNREKPRENIQNRRIISKISSDGKVGYLIYKHECEDFYNNSVLIVKESEEAFFMNNGIIEKTFGPGRYELSTQNYAFLSKLRSKIVDNGDTVFTSSIYFVNKASSMEMPWGTDAPLTLQDREYGLFLDIRARGSYRIKVANAPLFFNKIVGVTQSVFNSYDIKKYLRGTYLRKIKSSLLKELKAYDGGYNEFQSELDVISEKMQVELSSLFLDNGLECIVFNVEAVELTDESSGKLKEVFNKLSIERRQKSLDIEMKAKEKEQIASANRVVMDTLGEQWNAQQSVDIMKMAVDNKDGSIASTPMNIGVGLSLGSKLGQMAGDAMNTTPGFGSNLPSTHPKEDIALTRQKIELLKEMYESGILNEQEFQSKKNEILSRI